VAVELVSLEELATLASHFYEHDQQVKASLDSCLHLCRSFRPDQLRRFRDKLHSLKSDLANVREKLGKDSQSMHKTTKRIALVVQEFRSRCRETYTECLKGLDLDLRKILKPLVPSKVLDEQIKFRKINSNPSILSSLQSSIKSELREGHEATEIEESGDFDPQGESQEQVPKLNAHIELLVNTLETVAKELIGLCGDVNRRYYEVVNPAELISGPPTPLAAPLPEYFSFKAADPIEDQLGLMDLVDPTLISESQRQILVQKLMKLHQAGHLTEHLLQPEKVEKLRGKLESIAKRELDIRELNLEEIFRDESVMPASERERLVYSLINSERRGSKDVTLEDIINAQQNSDSDSVRLVEHPREHRKRKPSAKRKPEIEDSGLPPPVDKDSDPGNKSEIVSGPPPLVDNSFEQLHGTPLVTGQRGHPGNYYTPPADALRKPQSFFEQHRKSLPPITKLDKKASHGRSAHGMKVNSVAKLTRDERSSKDVRVRSVTPVQSQRVREEKKAATPIKKPAKSPVPGGRRGKGPATKKHSMS
jgi:hypothetical protein